MTVSEYPSVAFSVSWRAKDFFVSEIKKAQMENRLPYKRYGFLWMKKRRMNAEEYLFYVDRGIRCGYIFSDLERGRIKDDRLKIAIIVFFVSIEMKTRAGKIRQKFSESKAEIFLHEGEQFLIDALPADKRLYDEFIALTLDGPIEILKELIL